jgi:pyrroloquinoline quinone biosynthesis protein D
MKLMHVLDSSTPRLAEGCRWRDNGEERFLLFPEGALRLHATGLKILELCDGRHTFLELVEELQKQYSSSDLGRIREDAARFLGRLRERRLVDY